MTLCFLDCETAGLHGVPIILQYAFDDGPIEIHNFWTTPFSVSIELLDKIAQCEVIGFNLAFDWFHLAKMRTMLDLASQRIGEHEYGDENIDEMALIEKEARDGKCFKPRTALDLMLHARKTEFQSTMERKDIRIRRVPTPLADKLAAELEERIEFDEILFARRKNRLLPKWTVENTKSANFKNVVLRFKASAALKVLAIHALKIPLDEIVTYGQIEIDKYYWPKEYGYAPYALAVGNADKWNKAWPEVVTHHIKHWSYNEQARKYAAKDVEYTRRLYHYFGCPPAGDDDSILACSVAACRWRGYAIDIDGLKQLKKDALAKTKDVPTAPQKARIWISEVLSDQEKATFTSTGKVILQKMAAEKDWEVCPFGKCDLCENTGRLPGSEASKRAFLVLQARTVAKEIELYNKLLLAGRLHASFRVIGALSGRMSGGDKLNAMGIKKTKAVRSKFPLAFGRLKLYGGDFEAFEVVLADAAYGDLLMRKDLLTCENCRDRQVDLVAGEVRLKDYLNAEAMDTYIANRLKEECVAVAIAHKKGGSYAPKSVEQISNESGHTFVCAKCGGNKKMKIHAIFGMSVYPGMTYDDVKNTSGSEDDKYTKSKSAVFALIYGGEAYTLMTRLGVPLDVATAALKKFKERYPGVGLAQQRIADAFCSMRQEGGIGSKIIWRDPEDFVESLLGFKRFFHLENKIVKALFMLAEKPPTEWDEIKIKVRRRQDREQTASGAVRSALFGAAFQVQAANRRAASNHQIQSTGAGITKNVQRKIWDVQPDGFHDFLVQPMNIHDEIMSPTHPSVAERVEQITFETVESFRKMVPLIEFEWHALSDWSAK